MDHADASAYPAPPERHASELDSPTLPLPPPKDTDSLDRFVQAVASMPNERRGDIRDAIGEWTERSKVADVLHEALMTLPCKDAGRHHVLLSVIGELAESSSAKVLQRFVWLSDAEIFGAGAATPPHQGCDFSQPGLLQARAAEMLAWILKTDDENLVLRIIDEHPEQAVRVAAIDAYLFHRDDDPDLASGLRTRARSEDAWAVGLARRVRGMDLDEFNRIAGEHAGQHDHPDLPQIADGADDVY